MKHKKLPKENTLRVRLSIYELIKLEQYAIKHDTTKSKVIRDYIKRLPAIKMNFDQFSEYYYQIFGTKIDEIKFNKTLLKKEVMTLEEWLELRLNAGVRELPLDEWQEIAGW